MTDVDGNSEDAGRDGLRVQRTRPGRRVLDSADEEAAVVGRWLAERAAEGVTPERWASSSARDAELPRARAAVTARGSLHGARRGREDGTATASLGTMHLAKGLEFRAVAVMACDDEVLPLQARIEAVTDEGDLEEVYDTERHLLYVACTRARDHLLVTGVRPASEFLQDLAT